MTRCITSYINTKTGCELDWFASSEHTFPACKTIAQIKMMAEIMAKLEYSAYAETRLLTGSWTSNNVISFDYSVTHIHQNFRNLLQQFVKIPPFGILSGMKRNVVHRSLPFENLHGGGQ